MKIEVRRQIFQVQIVLRNAPCLKFGSKPYFRLPHSDFRIPITLPYAYSQLPQLLIFSASQLPIFMAGPATRNPHPATRNPLSIPNLYHAIF